MDKFDQSQSPYYGRRLDPEYNQVLFRSGMHVQSAELNETQLILKQDIKGIADCVLKDGDIRSGVQIILNDDKKATVTDGKIYLEGVVRDFHAQTIDITSRGSERIGVKLVEEVISASKDKRLLSPAAGFPNYGLEGADRLKQEVVLTVNDDDATTIFLLQDGNLINDKVNEDGTLIERFNSTLARRTYDESGHYKVWGLELSQKNQYDEDRLYLTLSEGKAYVEGWEIDKQTATTVPVKRSTATRQVLSEPKVYEKNTNQYRLNNFPVSDIKRVTALISVSTVQTRQGSINGSDPIASRYSPVVDIQSIKQVNSDITYKKNEDFVLEGDTVRWLQGGKQPNLGATYDITFTYNKQMIQGVDYKLKADRGSYYVELMENGDKPVESSQMQIDYDFYLHYIATITLDKNGRVRVVEGQPDSLDKIAPADITDQSVLILGYVHVAPMDDTLYITNSKNLRYSMEKIQRMAERLENMEVNQAITDLDKEAMDGEDVSQLKGIVTDSFISFVKSDVNHKEYTASINPTEQYLTSGYNETLHRLSIDKEKSTSHSIYKRVATGKAQEIKKDSQPYATESHLVNPYTAFPSPPSVEIFPAVDKWIDTNNILVQENGGSVVRKTNITPPGRWYRENGFDTTTRSSTRTSRRTIESAVEFMRPIEITVTGRNFRPYQNNIRVLFNDIPVDVKPEKNLFAGANKSLKADKDGVVRATFTVPSNVRCGTVDVKMYSEEFSELIGKTPYTANGTLKTTVTTRTTTTYVYQSVVWKYVDPIAQTIGFTEDRILTSVGLFASKVDKDHNFIVQIRETDNGYPSDVVLAEKVMKPEDMVESDDSSGETKVVFDDPVYMKADQLYAISILTESNTSSLWVQDLGKTDILTRGIVMKNPYIPGVMFSSSNAITWTAHQTKNIKFNLYCNEYETESMFYFMPINGVDYDGLSLMADTSVPLDTSLTWECSTDDGHEWFPLAVNEELPFNKSIDKLLIRAHIKAKKNISPSIALDSLLLVGKKNQEKSSYVIRNLKTDSEFTNVKVVADVYAPAGTGVVFYYATDIDGKNWKTLSQQGKGKVKEVGGYIEYTYTATTANAQNFRVKVDLSTNNSTITPRVKNLKCIMTK